MNTTKATAPAPITPPAADRIRHTPAALWASAFVILALILTSAARLTPQTADAAVATAGSLTVLPVAAGPNESVVAVLDGREETVYIYGLDNSRDLTLHVTQNLGEVFAQARAAANDRR